jgi:hypothetical protein
MTNPSAAVRRIIAFRSPRLAEGKRAICSEAGMPGRATVFRWIARHKEFRDVYTLACELRAEDLADEMIVLSDPHCLFSRTKRPPNFRACIQLGGVCQGTEQNQTRNTVL